MRKITRIVLAVLLASATFTWGQAAPGSSAAAAKAGPEAKTSEVPVYVLEYTFHEVEDGKPVNTRSFKIQLTDHASMRQGGRVLIPAGNAGSQPNSQSSAEPQYIDVGTSMDCKIKASEGGKVSLWTVIEIRGIAPDPSGQGTSPFIRTSKAESTVIVALGKTTPLASIDDLLSKRHSDIEVKVLQK